MRVAQERAGPCPPLADELSLTGLELGFLPDRRKALQNLAMRVDLPAVAQPLAGTADGLLVRTPGTVSLIAANGGRSRVAPGQGLVSDGRRLAWRTQKKAGYEADKWDILVAECSADGKPSSAPKNLTAGKDVSANEFAWRPGEQLVFTADDNGAQTVFTTTLGGKIDVGVGAYGSNGKTRAFIQRTIGTVASTEGKPVVV